MKKNILLISFLTVISFNDNVCIVHRYFGQLKKTMTALKKIFSEERKLEKMKKQIDKDKLNKMPKRNPSPRRNSVK